MGRRWQRVEVPSGWVQILKGPRPPSAQWPRAVQGGFSRSAWQSRARVKGFDQKPPAPVVRQSGVQGPSVNGNLQRTRHSSVNKDWARAAATEKARKLEKALEAMSDEEGPVVDALRAELKKAQSAAAVPALDVQIEQCQSFIARSQRWLAELDKQRAAEEELLNEARTRLERLRLEAEQCRATSAKLQTGSAPH